MADNTYRGLVDIGRKASNSRNYTQCDSLLMGNKCRRSLFHTLRIKIQLQQSSMKQLLQKLMKIKTFYCNQRGLNQEEAVKLIVNGFCKDVLQQLPMEFAVEGSKTCRHQFRGERRLMLEIKNLNASINDKGNT